MGLVRRAYGLTESEGEKVILALWPNMAFPVELWRRAHETFWQSFADSNEGVYTTESPPLPEINLSAKYFHPQLCALDVQAFFQKLSLNIQASTLRKGLNTFWKNPTKIVTASFQRNESFCSMPYHDWTK